MVQVVQQLAGHEDGVDDVDDAVRLEDIGCGDDGHAAFGIGQHDLVAGHGDGEVFALHGLEHGFAAALFDHGFELLRTDSAGDDVIGEDLVEGLFVLRLDERVDCACGKFGEGVVSGCEDGEGAGAVERVYEAACFDGCDEGFVNRRVDCVLDDGLGGIHFCAAYGGILLGLGGERGDGQSGRC